MTDHRFGIPGQWSALFWFRLTGTKSSLSCHGSGFFAVSFSLHNTGSTYNGSEWVQSELRDLENLFPKRDPDNRDAQDKSQEEVAKGQQPSAYKKPDDVQKERYRFPFVTDFLAERVQGNAGQLEALQTDGNADNGDAKQNAANKPRHSRPKARQKKPKNVANRFHLRILQAS